MVDTGLEEGVWYDKGITIMSKTKHPVRSIRISDKVFEVMQKRKRRGISWNTLFEDLFKKGGECEK